MRLWLRYLALATPVFVLLFLGFSPVTDAVFTGGPKSAADVQMKNDVRVVMVVMDEFPESSLLDGHGQVDATLFPNFAALADGSTWYRNTTTVAPYTQIAVPAILTGQYPHAGLPGVQRRRVPAEHLHAAGRRLRDERARERHPHLPRELLRPHGRHEVGTEAGVRGLVGDAWTSWHQFAWPARHKASVSFTSGTVSLSSNHALATGDQFVRSLQPGRAARLDFLHVVLPHQPWHYLPTGQDYEGIAARGAPDYAWESDAAGAVGPDAPPAPAPGGRPAPRPHRGAAEAARRLRPLAGRGHRRPRRLVREGQPDPRRVSGQLPRRGVDAVLRQGTRPGARSRRRSTGRVGRRPADDRRPSPRAHPVEDRRTVRARPAGEEGPRPIYKWALNDLKPARGSDFVQLDGAEGFRRAMRGRASTASGDPDLRLYRAGPYEMLLGRSVSSFPVRGAGPSGTVDHLERYAHLDVHAHRVPWAYVLGTLDGPNGVPIAIAADGRLVGVRRDVVGEARSPHALVDVLPPELMPRRPQRHRGLRREGHPRPPHFWLWICRDSDRSTDQNGSGVSGAGRG